MRLLEEHVKLWMDMGANGRPCVFQGDSAPAHKTTTTQACSAPAHEARPHVFQRDSVPAHKARTTQAWLFANVLYHWSPDIWPPSLPDCNLLDYFVWGILENEVNSRPYNNKEALKAAIRNAMVNMDRNGAAKACSSFGSRLEKVMAADGGRMERFLYLT